MVEVCANVNKWAAEVYVLLEKHKQLPSNEEEK